MTETATSAELALLGRMSQFLDEARTLLPHLEANTNLQFPELREALGHAEWAAWQAFRAVALVAAGAALDPRWGRSPSRPAAVLARRRAALEAGAPEVAVDPIPRGRVDPDPDLPPRPEAASYQYREKRTVCGQLTKAGKPCRNYCMDLPDGSPASGCHAHMSGAEMTVIRELDRKHSEFNRLCEALRAEAGVRAAKVIADLWANEMGPPAN